MNTLALNKTEKTKKLIELPNDVCRRLAVQAAAMGTSVKKLIENLVINSIDDTDDEAIYAYLSRSQPEGNIMMSDNEQSDLITRLRKMAQTDEI